MALLETVTRETQPTCDHAMGGEFWSYARTCGAPAIVFEDVDGQRQYRCVHHIKTLPLRDKAHVGAVIVERA